MNDQEWHALLPYLLHRSPQGRPLQDLRARMDAIFLLAHSHDPWRQLPAEFGKPDTVSRYFRRLTHAGLWQRLLEALADCAPTHPLRAIEHFILRATRRAYRILGLPLIALIRRIGLRSALPAPPWLLPDPLLSETLARIPLQPLLAAAARAAPPPSGATRNRKPQPPPWRTILRALQNLHQLAGGRLRISRSVRMGWP